MVLKSCNALSIYGIEAEGFALYFDVSLMIFGFLKDHNLTVFAVVCGGDSSKKPIMDSSMDTFPKFFLKPPLHL